MVLFCHSYRPHDEPVVVRSRGKFFHKLEACLSRKLKPRLFRHNVFIDWTETFERFGPIHDSKASRRLQDSSCFRKKRPLIGNLKKEVRYEDEIERSPCEFRGARDFKVRPNDF